MKHLTLSLIVVAFSFFYSCNDSKPVSVKHTDSIEVVRKDTAITLSDSMANELKMAHKRSMELFTDEQFNKFVEYIYPQFFRYLKDKSHSASIETEKERYVDLLITRNEKYWEKTINIVAPTTVSYSFKFKNVEYTNGYNNNIIVVFSQQAYYVTGQETIKNPKLDYGFAIYYAKKKSWYFLDYNTKDIANILKYDFDSATIKDILKYVRDNKQE